VTTEPADGAEALRTALRLGLTTAMKSRDRDALAALRTAIAAIDNAEAVPAPDAAPAATSAHIAGARSGLGSELQDILRGQISEHTSEADRYDALGQADSAARLRRQADSLAPYLP
jgi:uncharacterized protein YqeY